MALALACITTHAAWAQGETQAADPPGCQRIGAIRIVRTDVFDTRRAEEDRALFRAANALHIDTRESTLRQLLLFKTGEPYEPRRLRETERLMRSAGYLREVRIRPVVCEGGEAEIEVAVQDLWTLEPSVSYGRKGGANSAGLGLKDGNLFGLGTQLALDLKTGVDRRSRVLSYRDPLLGGRRLDLSGSYASNSDGRQSAYALERPFYALDTPWAAGLSDRRETRIDSAYEQGRVLGQYRIRERWAQVYAGISEGLRDGSVTRWTAGWTHDEHRAEPVLLPEYTLQGSPVERRLVYPWIGVEWLEDDFRETRNLEQIGRTEDLALGWHVSARLGLARPAFGADRSATVVAARLSKAWQLGDDQTVLLDGSADGRFQDRRLAGTLVNASLRYHLRQSPRRSFYTSLSTDRAINPDADQQVLIGGDSGLRGYPLRYQSGKGRWLFTTEQRWFTDTTLWQIFKVGGAVFYDMGRAWEQDTRTQTPQAQGLLRDVGVGLRLGNTRASIGSVVHLDLAFPLDGDRSIKKVQLLFEAKRSF